MVSQDESSFKEEWKKENEKEGREGGKTEIEEYSVKQKERRKERKG